MKTFLSVLTFAANLAELATVKMLNVAHYMSCFICCTKQGWKRRQKANYMEKKIT